MPDYVPALRGHMGDWTYYITVMKLGKVANEVKFVEDIHKNEELDELMQREIGERVKREMVPYLLHQSQRFYGALVVAVYKGEPEFNEVRIAEHELLDDNDKSTYGFGLLRFDGSQVYFALDGQHRLSSIKLAVDQNHDLRAEEVALIIVKHDPSPDGMERTRRLFSTLNRRAEKTKVGLNIAIDEDDPVSIVTRRLVREHPYLGLKKWVKANKEGLNSKQITPTVANEPYLTTLQALYEANEVLLKAYEGGLDVDAAFKSNRPDAESLDAYYDFLADIWTRLCDSCPDLRPAIEGRQKPGALRLKPQQGGGGNILARPLGQFILADFLSAALRQGQSLDTILPRLCGEISFSLDEAPWRKVIWNPETRAIVGGKKERALIGNLLLDAFELKTSVGRRQLLADYRAITQDRKMRLLRVERDSAGTELDPADAPE